MMVPVAERKILDGFEENSVEHANQRDVRNHVANQVAHDIVRRTHRVCDAVAPWIFDNDLGMGVSHTGIVQHGHPGRQGNAAGLGCIRQSLPKPRPIVG